MSALIFWLQTIVKCVELTTYTIHSYNISFHRYVTSAAEFCVSYHKYQLYSIGIVLQTPKSQKRPL